MRVIALSRSVPAVVKGWIRVLVLAAPVAAVLGTPTMKDPITNVRERPAMHCDSCVGLWRSLECWFAGVSWGVALEMSHETIRDQYELTVGDSARTGGYMTVRCCTVRAVGLVFDLCGTILENPIQMWLRWVKYMNVTIYL